MTDGDIPSFSAMVDLIILKCKDDEGNSIFAQVDSMYLLNQDVGYITGIATAIERSCLIYQLWKLLKLKSDQELYMQYLVADRLQQQLKQSNQCP